MGVRRDMRLALLLLLAALAVSARRPCTKRANKFCFKNKCSSSTGKKCFTTHKKNKLPKKDKRKVYCKKVKCVAVSAGPVCNCPMHIDYVCDAEGNKYDNVCAAGCAGLDPTQLDKCSFW